MIIAILTALAMQLATPPTGPTLTSTVSGGGGGGGTADCQLVGGANCQMTGTVRGVAGSGLAPGVSVGSGTAQGIYAASATVAGLAGVSGIQFFLNSAINTTINTQAFQTTSLYWAPTGAVGTPSFSWTLDNDTGFYSGGSNSNVINATTAGTLRLSIDTATITSTLPYLAPVGSVSNVAYGFAGDPNTGIRQAGADILAHVAGGMDRLTIRTTSLDSTVPIRNINGTIGTTAAYNFTASALTGMSYDPTSTGTLVLTGYSTSLAALGSAGRATISAEASGNGVLLGTPHSEILIDENTSNNIVISTDGSAVTDGIVEMRAAMEFTARPNAFREYIKLPSSAGTAPTKPACAVANDYWKMICLNDTDDALPGVCCICMPIDSGGTTGWQRGDDYATTCPL